MDGFQFLTSLVSSLAWPTAVVGAIVLFRKEIAELIGRLRTVKALGAEGTFDPKEAEATVALATATATAAASGGQAAAMITRPESDRNPLAERLKDLATAHPQAAVLQAYEEVDRVLRRRMKDTRVLGTEGLFDYQLVDVAVRSAAITRETAEALRGILVLRNLAAHDEDISVEKALDYLSLADAVIYSIEVARVPPGTASGSAEAHDAPVETPGKPQRK